MDKPKNKLKPLLPTLKEKKRYLAYEIISKSPVKDFKFVSEEIQAKSQEFLGTLGMAKAGIQLLSDYNADKQRGLIRVDNKYVNELKLALAFVKKIENVDVIINTIGVSGILNKAEERYVK